MTPIAEFVGPEYGIKPMGVVEASFSQRFKRSQAPCEPAKDTEYLATDGYITQPETSGGARGTEIESTYSCSQNPRQIQLPPANMHLPPSQGILLPPEPECPREGYNHSKAMANASQGKAYFVEPEDRIMDTPMVETK